MEDIYLLIGAGILWIAQVGSFFVKKRWIRLIPVLITVGLSVFCFVMYALSGFSNWGFLILLMMLFGLGVVQGILWLGYGIFCMLRKVKIS